MATPIPQRTLSALIPQIGSSPGLRVRIAADAFIPWQWVQFPEPPPAAVPGPLQVPVTLAEAALDFFVHGDGRLPVTRSDLIGNRFRILGAVDVDLIALPGELCSTLAANQPSKSELRLANGQVVHTETGRNPLDSKIVVQRLSPHSVQLEIAVSGAVPWNVAGPQPAIDLKYAVTLSHDAAAQQVRWNVVASHDGFPGHELFIESGGLVRFSKTYLPGWFSTPSAGTAQPSLVQAVQGAMALGGVFNPQSWAQAGEFKV